VIEDAINQQIVREMYSSNLYLAMSAYFASINLNGFSNWMHVQAEEEMMHALKFFDYLIDRGGKVKIGQIAAPPSEWNRHLQHSKMHSVTNNLLPDGLMILQI
jgi:ferritin